MLNKLLRTCTILITSLLLTACQEKTYDYSFSEDGIGGKGWPTWGEYLIVNEAWQVPVGNLPGGDPTEVPRGSAAALGKKPLPTSLKARWFSYRTQSFYEASLTISDAKQTQIKQWFKRYPMDVFLHKLSVGFAGQGEIQVWWSVGCIKDRCPDNLPKRDYFELVSRTEAVKGEGDPGQYRQRTIGEIKEGNIPQSVMELLPPEKEESQQDKERLERIMHFVPTQ